MEKSPTASERIAILEGTIAEQRARIEHLEELHRMQALPPFFLIYVMDFEGPKALSVPLGVMGEPRCMMCGELMHDGDDGLEVKTMHVREMNDDIFITRTALIHSNCYAIASRTKRPERESPSEGGAKESDDAI